MSHCACRTPVYALYELPLSFAAFENAQIKAKLHSQTSWSKSCLAKRCSCSRETLINTIRNKTKNANEPSNEDFLRDMHLRTEDTDGLLLLALFVERQRTTLHSSPRTNPAILADNRVEHTTVLVQDGIVQNDGFLHSASEPDLYIRANRYVWSDLG